MNILYNPSTDSFFNLALEEYLLRHTSEDFIVLWRSTNSVIIGKHQCLHAEIVEPNANREKVTIARRLSGGGTVFHDLGNLNFSFIKSGEPGKLVDFRSFIAPLADFLNSIGVPAELSDRNDIMIAGKKVSGNAEHVYKNRVLHHGTLLFDSNLTVLSSVLRKDTSAFSSRAVTSVRKPVTHIADYLPSTWDFDKFMQAVGDFLQRQYMALRFQLDDDQSEKILQLVADKYATREWIYDYSPKFTLVKKIAGKELTISVEKGRVVAVEGDLNDGSNFDKLKGIHFSLEELKKDFQLSFVEALLGE